MLFGCSEKHTWKELSKFDGGVTYYLAKKYDSKNNTELLSGSVRWVFEKPQNLRVNASTEVKYTAKEATILLNCKEKTFAMPDYSFHNKSVIVHWVSESPDAIKWPLLISNNDIAMFATILDKSCS